MSDGDGYELEPTLYRLTFENHPGMKIVTRAPAFGELLDIMALYDRLKGKQIPAPGDPFGWREQLDELIGWLAKLLESWNLKRKGVPVPADLEGIRTLELGFIFMVAMTWVAKLAEQAGVTDSPPAPAPNGAAPVNGTAAMEAALDLPMAPVSS